MLTDCQSKQTVNVLLYNNDREYEHYKSNVQQGMRRYCEQKGFTSGKITVEVVPEVNVTQVSLTFEKTSEYTMFLLFAAGKVFNFDSSVYTLPGFFSRLEAGESSRPA